jgi:predicted RNA polymerase sigma factor
VPALTAEALRRKGQKQAARSHYTRAIALAGNEPVRAYLRARRDETEFDYA